MKKLFITHKRLLCAEDHIDTNNKQITSNKKRNSRSENIRSRDF